MDQPPMDYLVQGGPRIPSQGQGPSDPASYPSPNPWITTPHPHVAPQHHWSPHPSPPPVPQFYPLHRARHPVSHPFHGHSGGLPPPEAGVRTYPPPEPLPMPMHARPWVHQFPQVSTPPGNVQPTPVTMGSAATEYSYGHPDPSAAGRGLTYQTTGEMGMGLAPPGGATSDSHALSRPLFPQPHEHHAASNMGAMPPLMPPYSPPTYIHQFSPHSNHMSHRSNLSAAAAVPRMARSVVPHPTLYPPVSYHDIPPPAPSNIDRRRLAHTRTRRSVNPRLPAGDLISREGEDDASHASRNPPSGRSGHRHLNFPGMEDAVGIGRVNVIRPNHPPSGHPNKMVVSRDALHSLRSVMIEQLPEHERTCVICYNDYGVETPEGINEAPLQLPRCKHIFGDHCIKKWFEDSDSCPYCRDKLPSEPKNYLASTRVYVNMLRLRGAGAPSGLTDETYARLMAGLPADADLDEPASRGPAGAERRSLPDDAGDSQRRIRPRRDSNEDLSHSEDDDMGGFDSATSLAPVRIPGREREQWMSRSSQQRRAALAALNHQVHGATENEGPAPR